MTEVSEALKIILKHVLKNEVVEIDLPSALHCYLAENVHSPINMPPFNQSAMDGYALCGEASSYRIVGEVKAGDSAEAIKLNQGETIRIFTGAMVPLGTTAIAKQEIVEVNQDFIKLAEPVAVNANIRLAGEELKINSVAMLKGELLNPAAIGFLNGLGITTVEVYRKPTIALVVTGNELVRPGEDLPLGKIYESNAVTLNLVLRSLGFESRIYFVKDDYNSTLTTIDKAINAYDLVVVTGGVSVGDYDFVRKVFTELKVQTGFYKVNQKPGKPLYFGTKGNVSVFGLPGNPAAALTCFYMYVLASIRLKMGSDNPMLKKSQFAISHDYVKKRGRAHFLKAKYENDTVSINQKQSSAMLSSFINANCLVYFPKEDQTLKVGSMVDVFILP